MDLSHEEIRRYSRHLIMPEFGMAGQQKLKEASVLIIGAGGLGCPLSLYLGAAGVGRIGIVDFDTIDYSNLQRQVIYNTDDVGKYKAEVAKAKIQAMNPHIQVDTYLVPFKSDNAMGIAADYDIIIDGTDNFPTRYLVNDLCVLTGKRNVFGSVYRYDGQVTVFDAKSGPCYRCLYPDPPPPGMVPSCAEGGVLGILPGLVGVMQASEAIKLIVGNGDPLIGRLSVFDALGMKFRELKIRKDPHCKVCSSHATVKTLIDYEAFCGVHVGPGADEPGDIPEVLPETVAADISKGKDFYLLDVRNPEEWDICHVPQAHLIPLSELASHVSRIPMDKDVVVMCHLGGRSMRAAQMLKGMGFGRVWNMRGGINLWANSVDPTMPRY